jgi:hypothetical protein
MNGKMNRYRTLFRKESKAPVILLSLLWTFLFSLGFQALASTSDPLLVLQRKNDEKGVLQLVLASAPGGLYMYDITVSVGDSRIARISSAKGVAIGGPYFQVVNATGSSIEFRALDHENRVSPGTHDATLAEIEVVGLQKGRTSVDVSIGGFVDDQDRTVVPHVESLVLEIFTPAPQLPPIGSSLGAPRDPNGDGLYEDVDGDGKLTPADVSLFASEIGSAVIQSRAEDFDFDGDGKVNLDDVRALTSLIEEANPSITSLKLEHGRGETGEEVGLSLILVHGARGLQRYDVVVSVSDRNVAQIRGAKSEAIDPRFFQIVHQSPDLIRFRAADFVEQIQPGAEAVVLATLFLMGMNAGEAVLDAEVKTITDDDGNPMEVLLGSGGVTIAAPLPPIGDSLNRPRDLNGDGLYEDVDGDKRLSFLDPLLLAFNLDSDVIQENRGLFDFDGDGKIDFHDAVALAKLVKTD